MKENFLNSSLRLICKKQDFSDTKKAELKYGLEVLYINVTKLIVIAFMAFAAGSLKETAMFFGSYALIRTFAFGLHAKSSLWCWILSIPTFVIIPHICPIITINIYIKIGVMFLCLINFMFCAPADTKKRPLVNKKKRILFKIVSCFICLLYIIVCFYSVNSTLTNLLFFATLIETFATSKLTYKFFNQRSDNYKYYFV